MGYKKHKGKIYKSCKKCFKYKAKTSFYVAYIKNNKKTLSSICKLCDKKRSAKWIKDNSEYHYLYDIKTKFNLSREDYYTLRDKQDNKCAICGIKPSKQRLHVDHCHTLGKVRGLLCTNCNRGIGHLQEDIEIFNKAIQYIKQHG